MKGGGRRACCESHITHRMGQAFLSCRTVITCHLRKGCLQRLAELLHLQGLQGCMTTASHCSDPRQGFQCSVPFSVPQVPKKGSKGQAALVIGVVPNPTGASRARRKEGVVIEEEAGTS